MQLRQHADGFGIAFRNRSIAVDHRFAAEILDDEEARFEILAVDLRRAEALRPQALVHGDEGVNRLGELGDRRVGPAPPHRRPDRARRRNHQQRRFAARLYEPFIRADHGGVARHRRPRRIRPAALVDETPGRPADAAGACESARTGERGDAAAPSRAGSEFELDVQAFGFQRVVGALGPFHKRDGGLGGVVPSQLHQLLPAAEAIEIRVDDGAGRALIGLHEREGGARNLEVGIVRQQADEGAGERCLAGAEPTRQRHEIACAQLIHENPGETFGRRVIVQEDRPAGER